MLKSVLHKLNTKREGAIRRAEHGLSIALENDDFLNLERKKRALSFSIAENEDDVKLKKEYDRILKKQAELLDKMGLSIEPEYGCLDCSDTGFNANGDLCVCVREELKRQLKQKFGLSNEIRAEFSESDFSVFGEKQGYFEKLFYKMQYEFCARFPNTKIKNFIFSGLMGSGKTFLATCIASDLSSRGFDVFFSTAFGLNNMFLNIHTSPIQEKSESIKPLLESDMLIIDDLGTESIYKNVTIEYLNNIINERLITNKHTLITTNLSLNEILSRYGERIWSRLNNKSNSANIIFTAEDIRLKK